MKITIKIYPITVLLKHSLWHDSLFFQYLYIALTHSDVIQNSVCVVAFKCVTKL